MVIEQSIPVTLVSYGVDLELLDKLLEDSQTLPSDMNLLRTVERQTEALMRLRRRMLWRVRNCGGYVFTQREIEAMNVERRMMQPPFTPTLKEIGTRMRPAITAQRVRVILRNADELMYFFQIANRDFIGWENTGNEEHPHWRLQAPTERQTGRVLQLVERAEKLVRKVA